MKRNILKAEAGQAIIEMIVCIIPLLIVCLMLIFLAVAGRENILTLIKARRNSAVGLRSGGASAVTRVDKGSDGFHFTNDDVFIQSRQDTQSFFRNQLGGAAELKNWGICRRAGQGLKRLPPADSFFIGAANLKRSRAESVEILSKYNLEGIDSFMKKYLGAEGDVVVSGQIFMPEKIDGQNNKP